VARLGGETLQAQTRAAIVAQADGVPLFVEELTKAVLETGDATVPASLHGSLMARLDRIPRGQGSGADRGVYWARVRPGAGGGSG